MKIKLLIIILLASIGASAQSWTSFGTGASQRRIVGLDTTYRWVGSSVGTYIYGRSEWYYRQIDAQNVKLSPLSAQSGSINVNEQIRSGTGLTRGFYIGSTLHSYSDGNIAGSGAFIENENGGDITLDGYILNLNGSLGTKIQNGLSLITTPITDTASNKKILTWDAVDKAVKKIGVDTVGGLSSADFINVRSFGLPTDSTTDASTAINEAIQEAKNGNIKKVYLPKGVYGISNTIYLPSNIEFYGDGMDLTTIKLLSSSTLDIIVPMVRTTPTPTPASTKWVTMIATETADYAFDGQFVENIKIHDLGINWNEQSDQGYSASELVFGRAKKSQAYNIKLYTALPGNLVGTGLKHLGNNMLFAFSDDCSLKDSYIGSSDYESVSIWYLSKRITIKNNIFVADKPLTYDNQTHMIQMARPTPLADALLTAYGDNLAGPVFIEDNTFLAVSNLGQMVTSHQGTGFYVKRNYFKIGADVGAIYAIKPFDATVNFDISNNVIDAKDYPLNVYGSTMISLNTSNNASLPVENGIIANNIVYVKNPAAHTGSQTFPNSPIIGGYVGRSKNITISGNLIDIDGYDNRENYAFGATGDGITLANNIVNYRNPFVTPTSSGQAFYKTFGGGLQTLTGNTVFGSTGKGFELRDSISALSNIYLANNRFSGVIGNKVNTTNSAQTIVAPVTVGGAKANFNTEDIAIDTATFRTVANSLSLAQMQTKFATKAATFTDKSIPFANSTGQLAQDNTNFYWDNTNKRVYTGKSYMSEGRLYMEHNSASGGIRAFRNNGGYPTSGQVQFEISNAGYNGTSILDARRAAMRMIASETWTSTGNGSSLLLNVTKNGTTASIVPFNLQNTGKLIISNNADTVSSTAKFGVKGETSDNTESAFTVWNSNKRPLLDIKNDGSVTVDNAPVNAKDVVRLSDVSTTKKLTTSGTGVATTISVAHGLTGITSANAVVASANTAAAGGYSYVDIDATNVNFYYTVAPAAGTNNLIYSVTIK